MESIPAKYSVGALIVAWYLVASIALHPAVGLYVLGHLLTTGVFLYGIWRAEQKALTGRKNSPHDEGPGGPPVP